MLITGGAGFIGCHAANYFAEHHDVTVLDNMSRRGTELNLAWLKSQKDVEFQNIDIRDYDKLARCVKDLKPDAVLHLAAQVAVTTSVTNPREDFEINATGTFNLLETVRHHAPDAAFLYASTNKVYGEMEDLGVVRKGSRYGYTNCPQGVSEERNLDFHSPYGCSKGAADQYVRDYFRIYGIRSIVYRQSCIYGTRQMGVEDQGWLAWFSICTATKRPITIFGDGAQVRDVLWVNDLVEAYDLGLKKIDQVKGHIYNIGGGGDSQLSLLELLEKLEKLSGGPVKFGFSDWRPGDQRIFVADTRLAKKELGWEPKMLPDQGVTALYAWIQENREIFANY